MRKYILLSVLLSLCNISNLYAGVKEDGALYREQWGMDSFPDARYCVNSLSNAGISHHTDCDAKYSAESSVRICLNQRLNNNENYGGAFYIAHEMNKGGAKFCRTIIGADRSNCSDRPATRYYNGGGECFWLCYPGFHGSGCSKVNVADTCMGKDAFSEANYSWQGYMHKYSPSDNIKETIPMFYHGYYHYCGDKGRDVLDSEKQQEHDVVLAIQKITKNDTDNSLQFLVFPLVVRAGGTQGCTYASQNYAWPMVGFLTDKDSDGNYINGKYLCPEGWKNTDGKCTQDLTSGSACEISNLCENFSRDGFDPKKYKIHSRDGGVCAEYRCIVGAFASKTDHTCVPCPATGADIPSLYYVDEDGLCQKCEVGQWPVGGECKTATSLSHNKMQYGQEGVPATVSSNDCWTMTAPDNYKACVVGGGNTNSNQALIDLLKGKTFFDKYSNVSAIAVPSQVSEMKQF